MDLQPIVLTQIVGSSEGVGAVLTEFVAGHPDRSILDVPRYLRRAMEQTNAGRTAVVEALMKKYPDVLNAPADVQRKLSKSELGRTAVATELIKLHPDVLSAPLQVRKKLSTSELGRNAVSEALIKQHTDVLKAPPDVQKQLASSEVGRTAVATELIKQHSDVLKAPPDVRKQLSKSELGRTAVSEALIKQHPDVLKAPPDVQKQLETSQLGRNAISAAWIKQYPDVLKAPPDVRKQLATSSRGRAALKAKNPSKKREVDALREELAQLERENKRLKTQSSAGFREKRAESERARAAITDALLSKYTSTSVQSILPEDLARLKSLNTPRAWEALSIKDAGGHVQSFEHLVQFYFTNLSNQGGSQSKKTDIVQWISNNWQTYFGSLKRLSQHQIHKRLSEVLTNGPYQKARYGNTVYWARVQPA